MFWISNKDLHKQKLTINKTELNRLISAKQTVQIRMLRMNNTDQLHREGIWGGNMSPF